MISGTFLLCEIANRFLFSVFSFGICTIVSHLIATAHLLCSVSLVAVCACARAVSLCVYVCV